MRVMSGPTGVPGGVPRFLLAHLGWMLLVTFAVTAAAAAFSWSRSPMYRAEVDVVVAPRVISQVTAPQPPDMGTEKAIVSSGVVISAASSSLLIPAKELTDGLSVDVPADTHVLKVQYSHADPREARRRAQGVAEAYVAFHAQQRKPGATNAGKETNDGSAASLAGMVQGVIITPAGVPEDPATPNHPLDIAVALIVGLALGLGTAIVRDRLDDRLRGPEELETLAGEPVLASIPAFWAAKRGLAARLVMVGHPSSRVAVAYRDLGTRVFEAAKQVGARTVLVTNAVGREKTAVAANLAVALAQSGRRVVLVSADLRRPRTHQMFGLDNMVGLTNVVGGGHLSLPLPLRATDVGRLALLPAGPPVADPGALLQSPVLPLVLGEFARDADIVVVEAPPLLMGADAVVLLGLVDIVLFAADFRRVTRAQVRAAMRKVEPMRHKLIGCVLHDVGLRVPLSRRSAQPPAAQGGEADTGASPHENGRYTGRVSSATLASQPELVSEQEPGPN
jgi:tyrosine-protein kinase